MRGVWSPAARSGAREASVCISALVLFSESKVLCLPARAPRRSRQKRTSRHVDPTGGSRNLTKSTHVGNPLKKSE